MPSSSLKDHSEKCQYAEALGTDMYKVHEDELAVLKAEPSFLYQNCAVEAAHIGKCIPCCVGRCPDM
jgi:hypothetical protein